MSGEKYPAKLARDWAFKKMRSNYSFYDEKTIRELLVRSEGNQLIEAFAAGYQAAITSYAEMREALVELLSLGEVSRYNSPHSCDCHPCTVVKRARAALRAADGEETE